MKKKNVAVYDRLVDSNDSWRDLFLSALKLKANVVLTEFFSDLFSFDGNLDVLVYLERQEESELIRDTAAYFGQQFDAKLIFLGHNIPKEEIPAGFIGVSQKDFPSEEDLINAILG